MILAITAALQSWAEDPSVASVLIEGEGRAFCAGGDIRAVYDSATTGSDEAADLWREQYLLNAMIVRYGKPVITVLDGITMGGGVGLGCHSRHRIVTENTVVAMPEVSIGLAPDVGGLLLLARAPGEVGTHLALTAAKITGDDAIWCGLADDYVDSTRVGELATALATMDASRAIESVCRPRTPELVTPLMSARSWIDECYPGDDLGLIVARLRSHASPEAQEAAAKIKDMSPLAVAVALRALRSAADLDDPIAVFVQDYRVTVRFLATADLAAGIRSAIITKDRNPRWDPRGLSEVTAAMVDRHFVSLGDKDLPVGKTGPG